MPTEQGQQPVQLLPAYLLVGTDELRMRRALTRLKAYVAPGLEVFDLDERVVSSDLTPADLVTSLNTMPVGAGQRIVVLQGADKLPKDISEALVEYLANPNRACTLCLTADKLARTTRLYKAVAACGKQAIIECAPKKRWELPQTVVQLAERYGAHMDLAAAEELVNRVGESTTMLETQVRTLVALCRDTGHITRSEVEAHIARTAEVKPWEFLDAVCARDVSRALSLYQLMIKPSQIALTTMLAGRIRELICAQSVLSRGGGTSSLAQALNKRDWQVKHHLSWARLYTEKELASALATCATCERELKTGADPDTAFIKAITSMCLT